MRIVGSEAISRGVCDLCIDAIAARAGVTRTTVQDTCRIAVRLGIIAKKERPRRGEPSLTNLISIASPEWRTWLARSPRRSEPTTPTDSFHTSEAWRRLRYKALKLYGNACQCCGSRKNIHVDHIKPRSKYPGLALSLENLQVLCEDCNIGKGAGDETSWR